MRTVVTVEGKDARIRMRLPLDEDWAVMGSFAPEGGVQVDVVLGGLTVKMSPEMAIKLGNSLIRCGSYWAPPNETAPAAPEHDEG